MKITRRSSLRQVAAAVADSLSRARILVAPHVAAELSSGERHGRSLYGVTVVIEGKDGRAYSAGSSPDEPLRSDVFQTRDAAEARIKELRKLARGH